MKTIVRLWIGLSVLWVSLVFWWGTLIPVDDRVIVMPTALGPVVLTGALLLIFGWAFHR